MLSGCDGVGGCLRYESVWHGEGVMEMIYRDVNKLKNHFRILKSWKVKYRSPSKQNNCLSGIWPNTQSAWIYGWDKHRGKRPDDFLVHELLHVCAKALIWIDRRHHKKYHEMEEQFVQDICQIIDLEKVKNILKKRKG